MRSITIEQHPNTDGTTRHIATVGCPLEPCTKTGKNGEMIESETCGHLHCGGVNDDGQLQWCCNKVPCRSGV